MCDNMSKWKKIADHKLKQNIKIDMQVRHCCDNINTKCTIFTGYHSDGVLYAKDGSCMSKSWIIVEWREYDEIKNGRY